MSGLATLTEIRVCTVCGFEQTGGHGEFAINCTDCGSTSWETKRVDL